MSKKRIIILSVLLGLLTLLIILFGVVFCLRKIEINPVNTQPLSIYQLDEHNEIKKDDAGEAVKQVISKEMLVQAAGLKKGTPIFSVNKQKVINNIETKFPSVKVVKVKTVSAIRVQIDVRQRTGVYYVKVDSDFNGNTAYYILDEELVIINKLGSTHKDEIEANYTELVLKNENVKTIRPCYDRLATELIQNYSADIFNAVCSVVKVKEDNGSYSVSTQPADNYVERETFAKIIDKITLSKAEVDDKFSDIAQHLYWVTMKITDGENVKYIQIYRPDKDLVEKINLSFSALTRLTEDNDVVVCTYQDGKIVLLQKSSTK